MMRSSILPLVLLSLTLAACGGGDESGASAESAATDMAESAPAAGSGGNYGLSMERSAVPTAPAAEPVPGRPAATPAAFATTDTTSGAAEVAPAPGTIPGEAAVSLNPMLIRTGAAQVRVDSLQQGIGEVRALAQRVGGIVGNTTISTGTEESRQATIELRIPSANFDRAITGLTPIGRVESVNVTAEDVGEEYTDVSARVANARRLESRLLDLLENRSGRLEEVLNLEREVARVREEIERYEGRLRYLRTRASVSVLTVTLHEGRVIGSRPGEHPIRDAFGEAWRTFIGFVAGFIASLGVLIPLLFLGFLAWRAFRWLRRRESERDAVYREALRRERERAPAAVPAEDEPAVRP